jgi:hypothetical protein
MVSNPHDKSDDLPRRATTHARTSNSPGRTVQYGNPRFQAASEQSTAAAVVKYNAVAMVN